ncbi:hypothetical protein UT300009_30570 [Paraclostridium bifermentans]
MKTIIDKVKKLDEDKVVIIDDMDEVWLDEISFTKGNVKFWIYEDEDEITIEVYQTTYDKNVKKCVYDKEIENFTTTNKSQILKSLTEIINNRDLYRDHGEFLKNRIKELTEKIHLYTEKRNQATEYLEVEKYQKYINRRLRTHEKLTRVYLTCIRFEEFTILKEGFDNKVLVEWYREKSTTFPTGREYSIHTKSQFGLIWGHYYKDKELCFEDFKKYAMTETEKKIMQWSGMNKLILKDFMKYAEKQGFHINGFNDDIETLYNLYTYFYKLGR